MIRRVCVQSILFVLIGLLSSLLIPTFGAQHVSATAATHEFCFDNPNHFACDGKIGTEEDDNEDDPEYGEGSEDDNDNDNGPNPYCDQVGPNHQGPCHDRKDYSDTTGLYHCNDGTQKTDWRDCKDASKVNDNDNDNDNDQNCYDGGYEDGQNGPFNKNTFEDCERGNGDNDYYIGFRLGCTNAGNTIDVCESASDR